ncbi:MAG: RNA polymerase sigma factor [Acidobacteria bacterium]|nr:RNA polymerase sigma factor [Acidobacteriota bacterium]
MPGSPREEDPDFPLLEQVRDSLEGDLRAFEELVRRHQSRIVADCRHMTRDDLNSEDLAQEVFVKAFFAMKGFEGRSSFRQWLQRIKVHHCLNHLKRRGSKPGTPIDDAAVEQHHELQVSPVAERRYEQLGERERIAAVLNSMSTTLRVPLIMADMDELSFAEIASALGIGLSAAKMRVKRAREEFRRKYEGGEN